MKNHRTVRSVAAAAVAAAVIFAANVATAADMRAVAVASGSMEPEIPRGSLCIVVGGEKTDVGDVVLYEAGKMRIIHRVVEVTGSGAYVTKGDMNDEADPTPVEPERILGSVRACIPRLGHVILLLKEPPALAAAAALMLITIAAGARRSSRNEMQKQG